jgi:PhzF family phenazine biosynthesis protein
METLQSSRVSTNIGGRGQARLPVRPVRRADHGGRVGTAPASGLQPARHRYRQGDSPCCGRILLVHHPFQQVDVFTRTPFEGNPVAVVLEADDLTGEEMQGFARWTNLSETTFILRPDAPEADYRLRIFTPSRELPFAGHPTLGSCHAWLSASQGSTTADVVWQECGAGLVPLRRTADGLAFAAPPLLRYGPVERPVREHIAELLQIALAEIVDAHWVDNGPGWVAVLLSSAEAVLGLRPGAVDMEVGVVGPYPQGSASAFEVRAFFPVRGATVEDPVTGSLNASLAHWLLDSGRAASPYVASQGTALGRAGRVHISSDADGTIWVGGGTITCITGSVEL